MNFLLAIVVSILSYGAVPNDTTVNNANAINTAISDCADKGGGVVEVPEGTFTTGSVFLRSGVTLRLNEGAVLLGSSRLTSTFRATRADRVPSIIIALRIHNGRRL